MPRTVLGLLLLTTAVAVTAILGLDVLLEVLGQLATS